MLSTAALSRLGGTRVTVAFLAACAATAPAQLPLAPPASLQLRHAPITPTPHRVQPTGGVVSGEVAKVPGLVVGPQHPHVAAHHRLRRQPRRQVDLQEQLVGAAPRRTVLLEQRVRLGQAPALRFCLGACSRCRRRRCCRRRWCVRWCVLTLRLLLLDIALRRLLASNAAPPLPSSRRNLSGRSLAARYHGCRLGLLMKRIGCAWLWLVSTFAHSARPQPRRLGTALACCRA